jgi:hypothetical protein
MRTKQLALWLPGLTLCSRCAGQAHDPQELTERRRLVFSTGPLADTTPRN